MAKKVTQRQLVENWLENNPEEFQRAGTHDVFWWTEHINKWARTNFESPKPHTAVAIVREVFRKNDFIYKRQRNRNDEKNRNDTPTNKNQKRSSRAVDDLVAHLIAKTGSKEAAIDAIKSYGTVEES